MSGCWKCNYIGHQPCYLCGGKKKLFHHIHGKKMKAVDCTNCGGLGHVPCECATQAAPQPVMEAAASV